MFSKIAIISFLALLFFPSTIFAGGGLIEWVSISSSNEDYNTYKISTLNPGEQFVIRPRVHTVNDDPYDPTARFCVDCPIKISLENPQPDDIINQSSDKTDQSGEMYAKIISKIPGKRYAFAEVTLPESEFTRKSTRIYRSSYLVLNYLGATQWEPSYETIPGSVSEPQPVTLVEEFPMPDTIPSLTEDQHEVKRLNLKIEELEQRLNESNKKQSFLEEKLNQIINFLSSIFPFLKFD